MASNPAITLTTGASCMQRAETLDNESILKTEGSVIVEKMDEKKGFI